MPRPVDPRLRELLLEVGTQVFAESGFQAATMAEIGRRAQVTKGGVYFHFRSKEELFFGVLDHWRSALREAVEAPVAGTRAESLMSFLQNHLQFHFDHPLGSRLLRVLATELKGRFTADLREDGRHEQRALRARIRALLVEGGQDGSLFTEDPAYAAFLIASTVEGILDQWMTSPGDAEPFCHAEALASAILRTYVVEAGRSGADRVEESSGPDFQPPF